MIDASDDPCDADSIICTLLNAVVSCALAEIAVPSLLHPHNNLMAFKPVATVC